MAFVAGTRVVLNAAGRMCRADNGKPDLGEVMTVVGYRGFDTNRWIVTVAGDDGRRDAYYEHCLDAASNPQSPD